jgi:hypothetical protein
VHDTEHPSQKSVPGSEQDSKWLLVADERALAAPTLNANARTAKAEVIFLILIRIRKGSLCIVVVV